MIIGFTYNVKRDTNYSLDSAQSDIEFDPLFVINGVENAIKSCGHSVVKIEADLDAYQKLRDLKGKIDLVYNYAEGLGGNARESQIPLFCEMLGIPYTLSSPTTHAIKLNKHLTKYLLRSFGVNTPSSQVVTNAKEIITKELKFPLIVKPNGQGSSRGITNKSVVHNETELEECVKEVLEKHDKEALIEEYIDGREFTVGMIGTPPRILPIIEQKFDFLPEGYNKIAGYELKWLYEDKLQDLSTAYDCPAKIDPKTEELIHEYCLKTWDVLEVKDCARIDYRLSRDNKLYFLEINTIPGINPSEDEISYLPLAARKAGLSFNELVGAVIDSCIKRYNIKQL